MITIKIGVTERKYDHIESVDEHWINQQIRGLRGDDQDICVRVQIRNGNVSMSLATPNCVLSGGGSRQPNTLEQKVFDLWDKLGLNAPGFQGGNLVAFFKQARKIL